eukprot:4342265-Prymnesium_polylepis.1
MAAQLDRAALQVKLELKPGMAVLVDNWNVAHTRSEYAAGRRRIAGSHLPDSHLMQRLREVEKVQATAGNNDVQRAGVRTAGPHAPPAPFRIRCYDFSSACACLDANGLLLLRMCRPPRPQKSGWPSSSAATSTSPSRTARAACSHASH